MVSYVPMKGEKSKYRPIYETLRQEVTDGKYGEGHPFPSEVALMRRFGVARHTILRAIWELQGEGLVARRQGKGTFLTQEAGHTKRIALIVHGSDYCEIFTPISKGISQLCQKNGYALLFGDVSSQCTAKRIRKVLDVAKRFVEEGIDGAIFQPIELVPDASEVNRSLASMFTKAGVPVVLLDSDIVCAPERSSYDVVSVNHLDVGRRLALHLRDCGAKRIVYLTQKDRAPCVQARQLGVKIGCEGLPLPGEAVFAEPDDVPAIRRMLRRCRPDAVACYNDRQAALLLQTLNALGRKVPDDVQVAGFDDVQYARLTIPQLTTMHQPCEEIAAAAFRMLMDRIRNPGLPVRMEMLDSKLVARGSTK